MAWKIRPAHFNLRFVRAMRKALAKGETCCGLAIQTYHLLVTTPETKRSELFTACLVRDDEGTCMAICRELPEVLVFEQNEGDALAAVHAAIEEVLAVQGSRAEPGPLARPQASGGSASLQSAA
jgi:hypothetical protein